MTTMHSASRHGKSGPVMAESRPLEIVAATFSALPLARASQRVQAGGNQAIRLTPEMPALDALLDLARRETSAILLCGEALRANGDAATLHKLRVSVRRMRALLWAYDPLLGKHALEKWRLQFKAIADAAGETRNWDVLLGTLLPHAGVKSGKKTARIAHRLRECREAALTASRQTIGQFDLPALMGAYLGELEAAVGEAGPGPTLGRFARKRISRAQAIVVRRGHHALTARQGRDECLHRTRIAVKKMRYLLEFFGPVVGKKLRDRHAALLRMQSRLGELNDVVVAQHTLREAFGSRAERRRGVDALNDWLRSRAAKLADKSARDIDRYLPGLGA
jgi:CHAD domain-containing protein